MNVRSLKSAIHDMFPVAHQRAGNCVCIIGYRALHETSAKMLELKKLRVLLR
jgi:hypothetical protein